MVEVTFPEVKVSIPPDPAIAALQAQVAALAKQVEALKPKTQPPPLYDEWVQKVLRFADQYGQAILDPARPANERLDLYYYDAGWIYHNLAAYFSRPDYVKVRDAAVKIYRDEYLMVQPKPGQAAGWMIFPHGLFYHFQDTGEERSKEALLLLADNAAYSQAGEPISTWLTPAWMSREAAYNLMADLYAQDLGGPGSQIDELTNICLGHLKEWRDLLNGVFTPTDQQDCRCFMVGLTASALIERYRRSDECCMGLQARIREDLRTTLDLLWEKMYVPASKAMKYTDRDLAGVGGPGPAPDVNMLIAPAYAWLGQRDRADALFEGSVRGAYWDGHKQFNQTMRWAFDYLNWRQQA